MPRGSPPTHEGSPASGPRTARTTRETASGGRSVLRFGFGGQRCEQLHDLGLAEAAMSAGSAQRSETSRVRPAGDRLGIDVEQGRDLPGGLSGVLAADGYRTRSKALRSSAVPHRPAPSSYPNPLVRASF